MALVSGKPRYATVRAVGGTEVIVLDADQVIWLAGRHPDLRRQMDERYFDYMQAGEEERRHAKVTEGGRPAAGSLISFLVQQGIGEATDVLMIDESLCIRCDNCETACAETHDGTSRLNREAGATLRQHPHSRLPAATASIRIA